MFARTADLRIFANIAHLREHQTMGIMRTDDILFNVFENNHNLKVAFLFGPSVLPQLLRSSCFFVLHREYVT